jgi:hypothetical protein
MVDGDPPWDLIRAEQPDGEAVIAQRSCSSTKQKRAQA